MMIQLSGSSIFHFPMKIHAQAIKWITSIDIIPNQSSRSSPMLIPLASLNPLPLRFLYLETDYLIVRASFAILIRRYSRGSRATRISDE
jgi:hypothetical protein